MAEKSTPSTGPASNGTSHVAFATSDSNDIVLEISLSFEHIAALYSTDPGN